MTSLTDHPELALGPNPFFESVSPFIPYTKLPKFLISMPLADVNWKALPAYQREPLLNAVDRHFAPTSLVLEPAAGLQTLLRRSIAQANPLDQSVRKRCNQVGVAENLENIRNIELVQGGGMLLGGITGTGKSRLLKRALEVFAPVQVVDYGHSEAGGFYSLRQCVYLLVDHATNGTRGALLKRILQSLDEKVGSNYFDQHKKTTNIDTLLVTVYKLLTRHRVALLGIDEKQQSTFEDSPWRLEFTLFYLQLMNLGISVVLSGNPLAFEHMRMYSQVMRRFSVGGVYELVPAVSGEETWWKRDFVPQARKFSVVEKWNIDIHSRTRLENENSAGLPGLFIAFQQEVQRSALRRSSTSAEVCEQDYLQAQISPQFRELRAIAQSLRANRTSHVNDFIDISPHETEMDTPVVTNSATPLLPASRPANVTIAAAQRIVTQFKSSQTREANKLSKHLKALKTMSPDDIRSLGITHDLINAFESQLTTLEPSKKSSKAAKSRVA